MVQVLPRYDIGEQIGQGLGQGVSEATGVALQQALPLLLNRLKLSNQFGGDGTLSDTVQRGLSSMQGDEPSYYNQPTDQIPQQETRNGPTATMQGNLSPIERQSQGNAGGYLSRIMTPQEIERNAIQYAKNLGRSVEEGVKFYAIKNKLAEDNAETIRTRAKDEFGVSNEEIPEFMQLAQRNGYLGNPDSILTKTNRDFKEYINKKGALDNAFIPGFGTGLKERAKGFFKYGLLNSLTKGGKEREQALSKINPIVNDLINMGFEQETRKKLSDQGLSATEVEEVIHPLSKQTESKINSFPSSSKIPSKMKEDRLASFFRENVNPDTSLLVLRHKLWNEKGYDWEEIARSIRKAQSEGLRLTNSQNNELTELETQPPRQSLVDIFKDWHRPYQYFVGKK